MLCGDLNGREIQKRGAVWKRTADSLRCTAEPSPNSKAATPK